MEAYLAVGATIRSFVHRAEQLDVLVEGAVDDLEQIAVVMSEPGEWRGLVHADLGPGNVLVDQGKAFVIDFETAGLGFVPIEAMTFRCLFPQIGTAFRLPPRLVESMECVYEEALADCGVIVDARRLADAKVIAAAFLSVMGTEENLSLLEREQEYVDPERLKSRLRHRLTVFAELAAERQMLPHLTDTATGLLERLPIADELPLYPVFGRH